ncbi:MAG: alpha/beta hydrolase [Propionibacteriaceae bacterium]|jgi:pimeloyl-ACP methyl ester carboxylesterase|nr:alpha/beta hydrolase [Propionibacteriaceae bacterium]
MGQPYYVPGYCVTDRMIEVPLDWADDSSEPIQLFWREVCDPQRRDEELPLLLFLQGGPGGKGPRPMPGEGFLPEAVKHFRVLLPDQRGTGRSTPSTRDRVDAGYLSCFLADSIIRDFERLRNDCYGCAKWATLGQSYGGFLTLAYLSAFPQALSACYVAGGIPGVPPVADDVYRHTYPRAKRKSEQFYQRYPQDVALAGEIADLISAGGVALPNQDVLSVPRFQSLGMDLGMKRGAERLHWLLDEAFSTPGRLSATFLHQLFARTSSADDPLFWTLQEFIYGSESNGPINWAAERELANHPEFAPDARPLLFTGEHTFRWRFDEVAELRGYRQGVEELMRRVSWPKIYDPEQLARNEVPVQCVMYYDDLYVDVDIQQATLRRLGNAGYWVTNEYEHDGLASGKVFGELYRMLAERGGPLLGR